MLSSYGTFKCPGGVKDAALLRKNYKRAASAQQRKDQSPPPKTLDEALTPIHAIAKVFPL